MARRKGEQAQCRGVAGSVSQELVDKIHAQLNQRREELGLPPWDFSALPSEQEWKGTEREAAVTKRLAELNSPEPQKTDGQRRKEKRSGAAKSHG